MIMWFSPLDNPRNLVFWQLFWSTKSQEENAIVMHKSWTEIL